MNEAAKPAPPRRIRRRWLLLLAVSSALFAAAWLYIHVANARLERAIAEADRLDPRWRLADIEADRAVIPDEDNAALIVIAVRAKLPPSWNSAGPYGSKAFGSLAPNVALTEQQTAAVRDDLKPAAALQAARQLADHPRGRWPSPPGSFGALDAAKLLSSDMLLRAKEDDFDGALASCRAMLNCGRSVGDEPSLMPQLVRTAVGRMAAGQAEHALGQGEPSEAALAALQTLLTEEAEEPLFTISLRGERAAADQRLESLQRGTMTVQQMKAGTRVAPRLRVSRYDLLYLPGVVSNNRAVQLERMNRLVEITKLPPHEQARALAEMASLKDEPLLVSLAPLVSSSVVMGRYLEEGWDSQARLRCAVAALAAERYRRAKGRWPETLDDLKGEYLREVPSDPFDGRPLRYRKDDEGVVVYSVGPDGKDDGGDRTRLNNPGPGADIGFRLWDADKRRRPPPR
jgi:hypothetical protein